MRRVVVDTSAIIGSKLRRDGAVQRLLIEEVSNGAQLCITPQTIYEFWSVATRPLGSNGFGLNTVEAANEVAQLRVAYRLLAEHPDTVDRWLGFCVHLDIKGRPSHDARIVAVM